MQVTAQAEKTEVRKPRFPKDEVSKDMLNKYLMAMDSLGSNHSAYMEKLWVLQQECLNQNRILDIMNNVFILPIQVTVTSRRQIEAEEGKMFQELATSRHTPRSRGITTQLFRKHAGAGSLSSFCAHR